MVQGRERRKKERLSARLFIEFFSIPYKDEKGRGVVLDVSTGGFGVESEADLENGEVLECHLEIPLTLKAKVVRRISDGQLKKYGLQITNQSFIDKFLLKKMLKGKLSTRKLR